MKHLTFFTALFLAVTAHATTIAPPQQASMGLVTGPANGTYFAVGNDIASIAGGVGVTLTILESGGSVDNVRRIAGDDAVGLGIVQSDVLGFLKRSKNPETQKLAENLRLVAPLAKEEIHLIARQGITTLQDLNGKRVIVGEDGSGSIVTSVNIFTLTGVTPAQMLKAAPSDGIVAILKDQADAMLFVGGKPVKLFKNLEKLMKEPDPETAALPAQLHFVPLNDAALATEYTPAEITAKDYGFVEANVPTIAVASVLVARDVSAGKKPVQKQRCDALGKLGKALRANLAFLQENGHPKWKEVDLDAPIGIWKRDTCSWVQGAALVAPKPAVEKRPKPSPNDALEQDLLSVVKER